MSDILVLKKQMPKVNFERIIQRQLTHMFVEMLGQ